MTEEKPFKFKIDSKALKRREQRDVKSEDKHSKHEKHKQKPSAWALSTMKTGHDLLWEGGDSPPVGTYNLKNTHKVVGLIDFGRQSINRTEFYERRAKAYNYEASSANLTSKRGDQSNVIPGEKLSMSHNAEDQSASVRHDQQKKSLFFKKKPDGYSGLNPHGYVDLGRQEPRKWTYAKSMDTEGKRFAIIPALVTKYARIT